MIEIALGNLVIMVLVVGMTLGLLAVRRRLIPQTALAVTVNEISRLEAQRGERLLGVLQAAGIGIPAACGGSGTCGLCRVVVEGVGAGEAQATERGVLSATERRAHVRLACQVNLRGPCAVTVPADILSAGGFACRVVSNPMLAPLIRELVLELPQDQMLEFRAGAFMQLTAPAYHLDFADIAIDAPFQEAWRIAGWPALISTSVTAVTRAYSIASRPEDKGRVVFNIRLAVPPAGRERVVPPGVVSSWLFSLEPGDAVEVSGPFGDFHIQPGDREMIFVGGGVGMAPLRAMIHEQIGRRTSRRMRFFYGARTRSDLFYIDEFNAISAAHPNFTWTPALSDPAPGDRWTGATGFIHEIVGHVLRDYSAPEDCEYYLCGPPVMISAILATLERLGVEPNSIFNDDFGV